MLTNYISPFDATLTPFPGVRTHSEFDYIDHRRAVIAGVVAADEEFDKLP